MSYKRRLKAAAYSMPPHRAVPTSVQEKFHSDFEKGYEDALTKAQTMEKDGWNFSPVTMMQEKAEEKMARFKSEGYEVEFVPVANWMGAKMGIMLFRERPQKQTSKPAAPSPSSSASLGILDFARAESAFLSVFPNSATNDEAGAYLTPDRDVALVLPNAKPGAVYAQIAKNHEKEAATAVIELDKLENNSAAVIRIGQKTVNPDLLEKAVRLLGDNAQFLECTDEEPAIVRKNGVNILMAPVDPGTATIQNYHLL